MKIKDFITLVLKLVILFTMIIFFIGGSVFLSYKFLKGDYSISKVISSIANLSNEDNKIVSGLILGTDKGGQRTDFIMFVNYNPNNNKITMVSIPRDTKVSYENKKINSLYSKGNVKTIKKSVEDILDIPIKYYAVVNLNGFREIVDAIGGIPMYVPQDMKYHDPYQNLTIDIEKGYQVLDGAKAEGFVRYRSGYPTGDLGRIQAQQKFIDATIKQLLKPKNISKLPSVVKIVLKNVKTNVSASKILTYIDDVSKIKKADIVMERLPGQPKYINGISYFIYNKQETRQMVEKIFYKKLSEKEIIQRNKKYKVEVYNGTNIPGLASKTATYLKEKGFKIIKIGNSDYPVETTKIIERTRKAKGSYVKNSINVGQVSAEYSDSVNADITVITGEDINLE